MHILAVTTTLTVLAAVAVALRLYSRVWYVRTAGWDDFVIVASLMTDFVFYAFVLLELHYGTGTPESTLPPSTINSQLKALYFTIPFYNLTLTLTKISMALLYRRLFPTTRYHGILLAIIILVILTGLWMILSAFLFCIPVSAFWDTSIEHRCLPEEVVWPLNASLQITTDLTIVVLPMPVLARLKLPRRQKGALVVVFGLGFFVCAMSIVRLITLVSMLNSPDKTKSNGPTAVWSSIEANVAIICTCLPPLRPLITKICPHLLQPLVWSTTLLSSRRSSQQREKKPSIYSNQSAFNPDTTSHYEASITGQEYGVPHPDAEGIQVVKVLRWDCSDSTAGSAQGSPSDSVQPERNEDSVLSA